MLYHWHGRVCRPPMYLEAVEKQLQILQQQLRQLLSGLGLVAVRFQRNNRKHSQSGLRCNLGQHYLSGELMLHCTSLQLHQHNLIHLRQQMTSASPTCSYCLFCRNMQFGLNCAPVDNKVCLTFEEACNKAMLWRLSSSLRPIVASQL